MLYLVDGYNVTKSDPATRSLSLEGQRDAVVARLRVRGRELLGAGSIVVVFDGGEGGGISAARSGGHVAVRFSRHESADDAIVRLAESAPDAVCVVSSDAGLAHRVRGLGRAGRGVEVRGRQTVYEAARGTSRSRRRTDNRYPDSSAGVPAGGNRITEELKALWLTDEVSTDDEE